MGEALLHEPVRWLELSVSAPAEFADPLSYVFHRHGHGGVVIENNVGYSPDEGEAPLAPQVVIVRTFLPMDATALERRAHIDLAVRLIAEVAPVSVLRECEVDQKEWEEAWKSYFDILHVGRRIVICPSWREYEPCEGEVVVLLDPGMAFGTGHHPTTRMCLEILERLMGPGMNVLDVGCGSAILSIAAARLGATSVLGIELDSIAAKVAKANVAENHLSQAIQVAHGTFPRVDVTAELWDIVVANISFNALYEFSSSLVAAARPGGLIITSGILKERQSEVAGFMAKVGATLKIANEDGDWAALVFRVAV